MKYCPNYTGVTCVNGSCPAIDGYGVPCEDCWFNSGCDDCYFCGEDGECEINEMCGGKRVL